MTANSKASINRQIGAIFMIIGTEIGAGILALPLLVAHFGFVPGSFILFCVWALMTYTTFGIAEIALSNKPGTSFIGMGKNTFGKFGKFMLWFSSLLILYPILVAYISAAGSNFSAVFKIPEYIASILFVIILGVFVIIGTKETDWVNRLLLITKIILLVSVCSVLIIKSNPHYLFYIRDFSHNSFLIAIPIFVTTCVGQVIVPSINIYLNSDAKALKRVIWIGCTIPIILYLLWMAAITGNIPPLGNNSLEELMKMGTKANIGDLLKILQFNVHNNIFIIPVYTFTSISVATSFLVVSLSLKDLLIDALRLPENRSLKRELLLVFLVFIMPLLIVITFKKLFLKALGIVGLALAILLIISPTLMLIQMKNKKHKFNYNFLSNNFLNYFVCALGYIIILIELYDIFWNK